MFHEHIQVTFNKFLTEHLTSEFKQRRLKLGIDISVAENFVIVHFFSFGKVEKETICLIV